MPQADIETVRRTAHLARLSLSEQELAHFAEQFARILDAFQAIAKLDVEGVEPMTTATEQTDVMREDAPRPSLASASALANAPARREDYYEVPKTVGGEG